MPRPPVRTVPASPHPARFPRVPGEGGLHPVRTRSHRELLVAAWSRGERLPASAAVRSPDGRHIAPGGPGTGKATYGPGGRSQRHPGQKTAAEPQIRPAMDAEDVAAPLDRVVAGARQVAEIGSPPNRRRGRRARLLATLSAAAPAQRQDERRPAQRPPEVHAPEAGEPPPHPEVDTTRRARAALRIRHAGRTRPPRRQAAPESVVARARRASKPGRRAAAQRGRQPIGEGREVTAQIDETSPARDARLPARGEKPPRLTRPRRPSPETAAPIRSPIAPIALDVIAAVA